MASYEDSEIYKLAKRLAVEIHKMTLEELPTLATERFRYFYPQYRKLGSMIYNLRKALIEGRAT